MGGGLDIPGTGSAPGGQAVAFAAGLTGRSGKAPVIEAARSPTVPGGPGRCRYAPCSPPFCAWRWMTGRCSSPRPPNLDTLLRASLAPDLGTFSG